MSTTKAYYNICRKEKCHKMLVQLPEKMDLFFEEYRKAIAGIFGKYEVRIILYGSYARGDFHVDSDIDIMVLADIDPDEVSLFADKLYDITYDFEEKFDLEINPILQSKSIFEQWKNVYPFFMNVEKEGINI